MFPSLDDVLTTLSVAKNIDTYGSEQTDMPIGDRLNLCYASTIVTKGRGTGITVGTAMNTQVSCLRYCLESIDGLMFSSDRSHCGSYRWKADHEPRRRHSPTDGAMEGPNFVYAVSLLVDYILPTFNQRRVQWPQDGNTSPDQTFQIGILPFRLCDPSHHHRLLSRQVRDHERGRSLRHRCCYCHYSGIADCGAYSDYGCRDAHYGEGACDCSQTRRFGEPGWRH